MKNYKSFISLLEQKNINLEEYPLKSLYRKLKRIMDTNFDTVYAKHIPETLSIFGEYNKEDEEEFGYYGKEYRINKKTWKIEKYYSYRPNLPESILNIL